MKRAGWDQWLERLRQSHELHGSTLIDEMIGAANGRWYVGPSDADDALKEAEREGTIVRLRYEPTLSQRAFAGLSEKKINEYTKRFYASRWVWRAK